jgi:large subunit ribosomal protein L9
MKIVMRQDVENVGESGTIQTVADGYARNYLIPKGFAVLATPGEMKVVAENQKVKDRKIARQETELQSLADAIQGQRLSFEARSGREGRLFGSVTSAEVADQLSQVVGQEIDRRKVLLSDPIRSTGEHTVVIHLVGKLRPEITVIVKGLVDETEVEEVAEAIDEAVAETEEVEEIVELEEIVEDEEIIEASA